MGRRRKHNRLWREADDANEAALQQLTKAERGGTDVRWPFSKNGTAAATPVTPTTAAPATPALKSTGTYRKKDCTHEGKDPLFALKVNGVPFSFAGAKGHQIMYNGGPPKNTVLVVDLAGCANLKPYVPKPPPHDPFFKSGPALFAELEPPKPEPPPEPEPLNVDVLRLEWFDQKAPPTQIGLEWWQKFLVTLPKAYPEGGHVIINCVGSHGRTGTALASVLLAANPSWSLEKAVLRVRTGHCHDTIESRSQWAYLCSLRPDEPRPKWIEEEMTATVTTYVGVSGYNGYAGAH